MNAIHAGSIQGDLVVGDIQQVQIYVLGADEGGASARAALGAGTAPYKFLTPYTALDRNLFFGREEEIKQVLRRIREQPLLVLQGAANVGKTSLLGAGVIPRLIAEDRVLVVSVPDYFQPVKGIREALERNAEALGLELPQEHTLLALVRAVTQAVNGCLVLVLDHFERLYESSIGDGAREELIQGLVDAQHAVEPQNLRIVFSVRQEALPHMWKLFDRLPELAYASYELVPLTSQQARAAILEPLHALDDPITMDEAFVSERLIPDLAELSPDSPGIQPAHLQIVCHYLYQRTRDLGQRHLTGELYDRAKGASGIMTRHVQNTLETELSGENELAERILLGMASPRVGHWVAPDELSLSDVPPKAVYDVLEKLVQTELLTPRSVQGERRYAFACEAFRHLVRELASDEDQRHFRADDELERAWAAWLARDAIATPGQLRFLERYGGSPAADGQVRVDKWYAHKQLFLLRSAAACSAPVETWLTGFSRREGVALMRQLEEGTPGDPEADAARAGGPGQEGCGQDMLSKAKQLLGLTGEGAPPLPESRRGYGPVAWTAVMHPDPDARHTSALALTTLGHREALDRLGHALFAGPGGWTRRQRANELRGLLADAAPDMEQSRPPLAGSNSAWAWEWRMRRRIARDGPRLGALTAVGAIGAGVGLGLMRWALALPDARGFPGIQLGMYFYWGAILGAALSFGMALAGSLQTHSDDASAEYRSGAPAQRNANTRPGFAGVLLGGAAFGIANALCSWLNGMPPAAPSVIPIGFAAGLGLAAALYRQPEAGLHLGVLGWAWRLGIAVLTFLIAQAIPIVAQWIDPHAIVNGIAVAWNGAHYEAAYYDLNVWGLDLVKLLTRRWFDIFALADAALLGVVLAVGMTLGLVAANNRLRRWQELRAQAGE